MRRQQHQGCRYCGPLGRFYLDPASVYVLKHVGYEAVKVGVSSATEIRGNHWIYDRISEHKQRGWSSCFEGSTRTGAEALRIEWAILNYAYNSLGVRPFLTKAEMPKGGWTETFKERDLPAETLCELVRNELDSPGTLPVDKTWSKQGHLMFKESSGPSA
ncbi:hypothetical protein [Streptomyces sp. cg36]|uniref:hypothetical protein n=1 Tax=Streptomyces sp. cg36 TaxID=3238798 RepID=UPI0034E26A76